jgi:hypothetical protein
MLFQAQLNVGFRTFSRFTLNENGLKVELYDRDLVSGDDLLHSFMIYPDQEHGAKVEKLDKGEDGSIYTLYLDFH